MNVNRAGSLLGSPNMSSRYDQSARSVIAPLPAGIVSSGLSDAVSSGVSGATAAGFGSSTSTSM